LPTLCKNHALKQFQAIKVVDSRNFWQAEQKGNLNRFSHVHPAIDSKIKIANFITLIKGGARIFTRARCG